MHPEIKPITMDCYVDPHQHADFAFTLRAEYFMPNLTTDAHASGTTKVILSTGQSGYFLRIAHEPTYFSEAVLEFSKRESYECSATPFLHSSSSGHTTLYYDAELLGMKPRFARKIGMGSTKRFDMHGDTDQWVLISAI
ncbi:hypothetical protein M405DRAFT_934870 [Rhizopogon salebrosus TDB-379]|nr:hypothetical protein M405DRAFT_934870 [Rhizopogon salebrosus TDB-379]